MEIEQIAAAVLVLLLLAATLWALRRRGFAAVALNRKTGIKRLECVERLALGPQQMLYLVRMQDTELLLASSPSGCKLLKSYGRTQEEADQ
jgi:flagellar biosynthetic protein FliO